MWRKVSGWFRLLARNAFGPNRKKFVFPCYSTHHQHTHVNRNNRCKLDQGRGHSPGIIGAGAAAGVNSSTPAGHAPHLQHALLEPVIYGITTLSVQGGGTEQTSYIETRKI